MGDWLRAAVAELLEKVGTIPEGEEPGPEAEEPPRGWVAPRGDGSKSIQLARADIHRRSESGDSL